MSNNLTKITMHWTVTGYKATATSLKHYHSVTEGDGTQVMGNLPPEANESTSTPYVAHALNFNTGNIGMSVSAMLGAEERPFTSGKFPITQVQLEAFVKHVAAMAKKYNIPVTRDTVFTHAEIQGQFGVEQEGKWDIRWLPNMEGTRSAVEVGDILRQMIKKQTQSPWLALMSSIMALFGVRK